MAEVRQAAVATFRGIGRDLPLWSVAPVALFDAARRETQAGPPLRCSARP
ncbi:hypothetical protein WMF45_30545 [Sorangium sp. So ce448]